MIVSSPIFFCISVVWIFFSLPFLHFLAHVSLTCQLV
jgi:hypothetical protein